MNKAHKFIKVSEQLRRLEIGEDNGVFFESNRYNTVVNTACRLKSEGLKFSTKKFNENVYVWRLN